MTPRPIQPPPDPTRKHAPAPARVGRRARARGVSLVEALIAFLVVSAGMLGLMRTQGSLRLNSEASRHRGEALRLAQQALEDQRAFATLQPQAGVHDYAAIQSGSHSAHTGTGFQTNTAYQVQSHVAADPHLALKSSHVEVAWTDRQGQPQTLSLHALVAGQDPALAASLSQPPRAHPAWGALGRSPFIPQRAKDLGNGRSAFKPLGQGAIAWVFDNASGRITATCAVLPGAVWHGNLTASHLTQCTPADGLLLSGLVRFSLNNPPAPEAANDLPLPLSVTLQLSTRNTTPPTCLSEPVEEVLVATASGPVTEWVPLGATPASLGVAQWTATGERFVSYHCLIDTSGGSTTWSGRSDVQAAGWAIGQNLGQYRVCRYSSDTDASGAIDRNEEHPATYAQVRAPLTQQHFLVVRGELSCPVGPPIKVDGVGVQVYVDWSTAQHQP
jgi:Tfp pilus assembly protein PilV